MVLGWRHDDRAPEMSAQPRSPGRLRRDRAADEKCLPSMSEALEGFERTRNRWQRTRMNRIDDAAARIVAGHLGGPWLHGLVQHLSLAGPSSQLPPPWQACASQMHSSTANGRRADRTGGARAPAALSPAPALSMARPGPCAASAALLRLSLRIRALTPSHRPSVLAGGYEYAPTPAAAHTRVFARQMPPA